MTCRAAVVDAVPAEAAPAPRRSLGSAFIPTTSTLRDGEEAGMRQRPPVGDTTRVDPLSALNRRDLQVLSCLADGDSTAQIAAVLSISSNTVRTRIRRIQGKLDVADREATVRAAHDLGTLRVPRPRQQVR
jgi:DNA-binding NarL/FixJ family response regulator